MRSQTNVHGVKDKNAASRCPRPSEQSHRGRNLRRGGGGRSLCGNIKEQEFQENKDQTRRSQEEDPADEAALRLGGVQHYSRRYSSVQQITRGDVFVQVTFRLYCGRSNVNVHGPIRQFRTQSSRNGGNSCQKINK